jgi:hypothetical protein
MQYVTLHSLNQSPSNFTAENVMQKAPRIEGVEMQTNFTVDDFPLKDYVFFFLRVG